MENDRIVTYNPELERDLVDWILSQCDNKFDRPEPGVAGFQKWLMDGEVSADFDHQRIIIRTNKHTLC